MIDFIKTKLRENIETTRISQYKDWLKGNAKPIIVSDLTELNKIDPNGMLGDIERYQKDVALNKSIKQFLINNIEINECFHNAAKVFEFFKKIDGFDVSFILGTMTENGKTFGHAWNKINDKYFDFTAEKTEKQNNRYFEVVALNDFSNIMNLEVFNPDAKCKHELTVAGESYDINGMCSLYPYYINN